jgi:hypothetical protein
MAEDVNVARRAEVVAKADRAVRAYDLLKRGLGLAFTQAYRLEHLDYLLDRVDAAYRAGWQDGGSSSWVVLS